MKNLLYLACIFLITACSSEKSDEELLEKDRETLQENLISGKVVPYKFVKLMFRGYASDDTTSASFKEFKSHSDDLVKKVMRLNHADELSAKDYWAMYQLYDQMDEFVTRTDEDRFPVIVDAFRRYWNGTKSAHFFKGKEKAEEESREHAFLTILALASQSLGTEIALYECAETDVNQLPDSELKADLRFLRGLVFMQKGLYYLSEKEYSDNLEWLKQNPSIDLSFTMNSMKLGHFSKEQSSIAFGTMNRLFRGVDRLMMEREKDEKRALEDFESVLNDCKKLKIDNELVWAIDTYVQLKKGNDAQAIASLKKLRKSSLLTDDDKALVDESIAYLKKDDAETVAKEFFDQVFLLKIAGSFMYNRLKDVDSNKLLQKGHVPNGAKIAEKTAVLENTVDQIDRFSNGETLHEAARKAGEEGKSIFDEAKDFFK